MQLTELRGSPSWVGNTLALGWVELLVGFFVWAPWLLTHKRITPRDLLPGAVLTAVGEQHPKRLLGIPLYVKAPRVRGFRA